MLASPDPISLPAPTFNAWYHQSRRQAYLKTGRQSSLTKGLKRAHTAPERSTSDTAVDVQIVADQRSTPLTADRLQEQCQHDPAYCIHRWLDSQDTSEHLFVDEPSLHEQCQSWQISDATNLSTKQSVKNDAKHDTVLQWPGEEVFLHLGTWDTSCPVPGGGYPRKLSLVEVGARIDYEEERQLGRPQRRRRTT